MCFKIPYVRELYENFKIIKKTKGGQTEIKIPSAPLSGGDRERPSHGTESVPQRGRKSTVESI